MQEGDRDMKLYYHPASTTCRAVMLGAAEMGIALDFQLVDLMTGEHLQPAYAAINPNCLVPCLEDRDFRLTESATILRYLAELVESPAYPQDLRQRARVNEILDWVNSDLYKDLGYGLVYPQLFPHHRRPTEELQQGTLEWAQARTRKWLSVLDASIIGKSRSFLCGRAPTIADYFSAPIFSLTELIHADTSAYANINRWYQNVKALKSWPKVNEAFDGFTASLKDTPLVSV
jgi:glutathione S-transferase